MQHRTIEERLEEIEYGVHEIKALLLKLTLPNTFTAEKLVDEFMNVKELSKFAKVETSFIYAACTKRDLKFIKLGKLYKFRKKDVLEWLDKNQSQKNENVDEYVEKYLQKHVLKG